jgi:subtilisin family serine protease
VFAVSSLIAVSIVAGTTIAAPGIGATENSTPPQAANRRNYVEGEIIVKLKSGISKKSASAREAELGIIKSEKIPFTNIQRLKLSGDRSVAEMVEIYRNLPEVEYAQPNYIYGARATTPDDPSFAAQWGFNNTGQDVDTGLGGIVSGMYDADIDAPEAWDVSTGSDSVIVAVIDTGVDYNHPDLKANIWQNLDEIDGNGIDDDANGYIDDVVGWDFWDNDNNPMDFDSHGTHIAGIIGAVGNNGVGVAGIMWNVKLMPIRSLDTIGLGTTLTILEGINYAVANGAKVINLSFGGNPGEGGDDVALKTALADAGTAGVLAVIASGNEENDNDLLPVYPASFDLDNIISVAASAMDDTLSYFSNYGAASVDIAAPGEKLYSTVPAREKVFYDDFESGLVKWTTGKDSGYNWQIDPGDNNIQGLVGLGHLVDSYDEFYQSNTDSWVTTKEFSLAGKEGCKLSFWVAGQVEIDKDYLYLKASNDNFATTGTILDAWSKDTLPYWGKEFYDLKAFEGEGAVSIRLHLVSDGSVDEYAGVSIDDFTVSCSSETYDGTEYAFELGTSMAAPFVAGTAALVLSEEPGLTVTDLRSLILDNGDPIADLSGLLVTGSRVNVLKSLAAVVPVPPTTTATPAGGSYTTEQSVVLSCEAYSGRTCAATYYTTDGTEPDTSSTLYSSAISVKESTTLKFFSVDSDGLTETANSETFTIESNQSTTTPTDQAKDEEFKLGGFCAMNPGADFDPTLLVIIAYIVGRLLIRNRRRTI